MASVPYALKAADSATLGGLPASAFVLAGSKAAAGVVADAASAAATPSNVTTVGGTDGYVPEFTGASTIANSPIFASATDVGIGTAAPTATLDVNGTALIAGALTANGGATIGGQFSLPATGAATATTGQSSQSLLMSASAFNSSTAKSVAEQFERKAEPTANDTSAPLGTLNLLSSSGSALAEIGFHFNANGTISFAPKTDFSRNRQRYYHCRHRGRRPHRRRKYRQRHTESRPHQSAVRHIWLGIVSARNPGHDHQPRFPRSGSPEFSMDS
jgi:hypothetical protein